MTTRTQTPTEAEVGSQERLEALIRAEYDRCCLDDTFDDLKRRARFSKEDKYLLRDWMKVAAQRDREQQSKPADIIFIAAE